MTRYKDFGAGTATVQKPLSFKLHGETFKCVPQVQGRLLLELIADSSSTDPAVSTAIITKFFEYVLKDESFTRFDALLRDKDKIVTVETLGEITGWLVEEYTKRPEAQPEVS